MLLKEYLGLICIEKDFVVKLSIENLRKYKTNFYSQPFKNLAVGLALGVYLGRYFFKRNKKNI